MPYTGDLSRIDINLSLIEAGRTFVVSPINELPVAGAPFEASTGLDIDAGMYHRRLFCRQIVTQFSQHNYYRETVFDVFVTVVVVAV